MSAILTSGSIHAMLWRLSGPMVWGMLAILSLNLVDIFFIAKLGKNELAAMSYCLPVIMTLMSLALGFSVGTGSILSRAIGSHEQLVAKRALAAGFVVTILVMTAAALAGIFFLEPLFLLLRAPQEVLPCIRAYMGTWLWGLPAMGAAMIANTAQTAAGDTKTPAVIMLLSAVVNLFLDPVLIFGCWLFPSLGMQGAGLATVIAYLTALLLSMAVLVKKGDVRFFSLRWKDLYAPLQDILLISLPAASSQLVVPVTGAITVWMLSDFGSEVVGGYGIVSRVEAFSLIVVVGLSNGVAPFIGQNFGAGLFDRVHHCASIAYKFALVWGGAVAAALVIGYKLIPHIFVQDMEVEKTVSLYLLIVPASYGAAGSLFVTNAILNSLGFAQSVACFTFARYFLLYLPLASLLGSIAGPAGIFAAISCGNILTALLAYLWTMRKMEGMIARPLALT